MFSFFSRSKGAGQLWFETDIHCHVIPGVDDGCPDADTSLEVISRMHDLGLRRIIASPHVTEVTFENDRSTLEPAYRTLLDKMKAEGGLDDMEVFYSSENRIDGLFTDNFDKGSLITVPVNDDKYVLIENAFVQEPWDLDNTIFQLKVRGFSPILVHPERFIYYHERPERLAQLHANVPFQINVLSLAGYYGKQIRKFAESLIDKGFVDYLGTDIHNVRHTESIAEYLKSSQSARDARALSGIRNDIVFGAAVS